MKKLLLILSLMVTGLSGCYVAPYGGHDDGYRSDRDPRGSGDQNRDHNGHDDGRSGDRGGRDGYR